MDTPILDFLRQYSEHDWVRFHMPGHKGKGMLGCEKWDITEVNGADALAAGIREGVAVGAALEELLEKVIEGTLPNSRGVLLEQLASMGGTGADSCEQESLF